MQGGTVRIAAAGFLAVLILSALGPSTAAAVEAAEDQPPSAVPVEPETPPARPAPPSPPEPPQPPPPEPPKAAPPLATPPHPTPKPKPAPTPKPRATPKPKPKPKPTPATQSPGRVPGGQAPGDPVLSEPPAAPLDAPVDRPGGGAGSSPTDGAPGLGPPSRVHLVVAGATVSGIAAVAGWLVLGGRRSRPAQPSPVRIPQPPATTVTRADGVELDLEVVVNRPDGPPKPRYTGRVPGTAATTLWTDEDDRPRWLRRFDEQGPARPRAPRSSLGIEDPEEGPTRR